MPILKPLARFLLAALPIACASQTITQTRHPQNFIYTGSQDISKISPLLMRSDIGGVQIVYNWKDLELAEGRYDFSAIERDLAIVTSLHKKLFVQLQDRFFTPRARNVPEYLMHDKVYSGGIVPQVDNPGEGKPSAQGWVAEQWNPAVQRQYQRLIKALADRFDGRILGLNLPETAIDIDIKHDRTGFSCEKYFAAELDTMKFAKDVFRKSFVVQYVNFWPCEWNNDHQYMSRTFQTASRLGIGVGGPDIVPFKKEQMANSYRFFHDYRGKLPLVAMAVQEPTLTYTNPATKRPFTKAEFVSFGESFLGTQIIFWSTSSPWLSQPE